MKLSKAEWNDLRDKWESDPKLSFGTLATEYGISRQAITLKARRESWSKTGNLVAINREAKRRADDLASVDNVDVFVANVDSTPSLKKEVGFDAAVDKRVDVLVKHRGQITDLDTMQDAARSLFTEAMEFRVTPENAGDEQKVKTAKSLFWQAKIAADILKDHCSVIKIKHDAERKSYGFDEPILSPEDFASMSKDELSCLAFTGKLPKRFL